MTAAPKNVVLLGATGSIGESTLKVLRQHPDRLRLIGIAAGSNREKLEAIANEFNVADRSLFSEEGIEGQVRIACLENADIVLVAASGTVGIQPTLAAIEMGKDIALASKEVLVAAGRFVMDAVHRTGSRIIPVDSEHNALFQCIEGCQHPRHLRRLILTASGGPFRAATIGEMAQATPDQALQHPNWKMGPKVTLDSATMANKGLEMIEARWLFEVAPSQIDVVVHPQSIVHSMVEYCDGSIIAQLSPPSMTFAIQHALLYPERAEGVNPTLDFTEVMQLDFHPPDLEKFPCLRLARESMKAGGIAPAAFNAANEVAAEAFFRKEIPFLAIPEIISHVLTHLSNFEPETLNDLLAAEDQCRKTATEHIHQNASL